MTKSAIKRQRGSIIIPVAVSIFVGLILLGGVQLGYYFYMKRELQNTVDLAALSGVQLLSEGTSSIDDCNKAITAAKESARQNFNRHGELTDEQFNIECGTWHQTLPPPHHFAKGLEESYNALKVTINYEALPMMPFASKTVINAEAIAKSSPPVAAFQVGSELLRFDNSAVLGRLLTTVGVNIENLTLLNPNGVVNATITPSGLLGALGLDVGIENLGLLTPEKLAEVDDLTLGELLLVSLDLVGKTTLVGAEIQALYDALETNANLGGLNLLLKTIPLVRGDNTPGLFAFLGTGATNPLGGALDLELGIGQILSTALAVAANGHTIDLDVTLPGLLEAQLFIVEPPVIAIGPVGTTGYTAQVRLWLHLDPTLDLGPLKTGINLPIAVDVVSGKGTLENLQCSKKEPTMDVAVEANFLNICVGRMDKSNILSNTSQCHEWLEKEDLVRVIGDLIKVQGKIHLQEDPTKDTIKNLAAGKTNYTKPMNINLTSVVANLIGELNELLKDLLSSLLGSLGGLLGALLGGVLSLAVLLLSPILGLLDGVLTLLLKGVLGLEPGIVDVKALAIGCDPPQLVY